LPPESEAFALTLTAGHAALAVGLTGVVMVLFVGVQQRQHHRRVDMATAPALAEELERDAGPTAASPWTSATSSSWTRSASTR
jgi:hypothetical protein